MLREIIFAARALRGTPAPTAVALILLAAGVGATTAVFSVVDAVLRGLPFEDAGRLVAVNGTQLRTGDALRVTVPDFLDLKARQDVFVDMAATSDRDDLTLQEADGAETLSTIRATASLFTVLGVQPRLGRLFTAANETDGNDRVVVLSDALWKRRFGGDPRVVGRMVTFDAGVFEIAGVMPAGFVYPLRASRPAEIYAPYVVPAAQRTRGASRSFSLDVVARMKPGVTLDAARARMQQLHDALAAESPSWFQGRGIAVNGLRDAVIGPARAWMFLLAGAVGFVLLIVCLNVSGLLLARGIARARDIGIRAALGATRWQIARGLLIESLLLAAAGACCGVALAYGGVAMLRAAAPATLPLVAPIAVDVRVLGAAAAAALSAALICGLLPALRFSRGDVLLALRDRGPAAAGGGARRTAMVLVIAEVALAVILLVGAGLFVSSFVRLMRVDLGLDHRNVLTVPAHVPFDVRDRSARARARARADVMLPAVLDQTRAIPGVEAVAAVAGGLPLGGGSIRSSMRVPGREQQFDEEVVDVHHVTHGYFHLLRIPLLQGRTFADTDSRNAPPVIVLSEAAARRYFPDGNAVGASVDLMGVRTVVGVVGSVRLSGPERPVRPETYIPLAQGTATGADLVIRTTVDPMSIAPSVKAAIWSIEPRAPIARTGTLDTAMERLIAPRKFNMLVFGLFGALAIAVAATGLYGLLAQQVEQGRHEIGVRMALGAEVRHIVRMVMMRAATCLALGLALGFAGAWNLARLAGAFLFQVAPRDGAVYAAAGVILFAACLCATILPARRAARIDPLVTLKAP